MTRFDVLEQVQLHAAEHGELADFVLTHAGGRDLSLFKIAFEGQKPTQVCEARVARRVRAGNQLVAFPQVGKVKACAVIRHDHVGVGAQSDEVPPPDQQVFFRVKTFHHGSVHVVTRAQDLHDTQPRFLVAVHPKGSPDKRALVSNYVCVREGAVVAALHLNVDGGDEERRDAVERGSVERVDVARNLELRNGGARVQGHVLERAVGERHPAGGREAPRHQELFGCLHSGFGHHHVFAQSFQGRAFFQESERAFFLVGVVITHRAPGFPRQVMTLNDLVKITQRTGDGELNVSKREGCNF